MSPAAKRASALSFGDHGPRGATSRGVVMQGALVIAISGILFWVVWLYGTALRDARYLDGWLLMALMALQVYYHLRRKTSSLSPKAATLWRQIHIFAGYVLVAVFLSHSNWSLPDTYFEWALWGCTVLVVLSGIIGTYLAWVVQAKLRGDNEIVLERIPKKRAELANEVRALATTPRTEQLALELPVAPYKEWILDFYTSRLEGFFRGPSHPVAHIVGSQRHMKGVIAEIDDLERYVDKGGREKLSVIKAMVIEKDRLDFALVQLQLSKVWLLIHVPVTYSLIVLIVLHALIVYSYSSGVW